MGKPIVWQERIKVTESCWLWTGPFDRDGYGRCGKSGAAHRVALTRIGIFIPAGMHVDHMCRTRACVNPEHLRIVTPRQNATQNSVGIAAKNAAKVKCQRCGSAFRTRKDGSRECRTCHDKADAVWKASNPDKKKLCQSRWRRKNKA